MSCHSLYPSLQMRKPMLMNLLKVITSEGQSHLLFHFRDICFDGQQLTIASIQEARKWFLNEWMLSCFPLKPHSLGSNPSSITYWPCEPRQVIHLSASLFSQPQNGANKRPHVLLWRLRKLKTLRHVKSSVLPGTEETLNKTSVVIISHAIS